ncbi:WavE lipopolysaccharide synthesis [Vibrio breoganii]|uniref:WavE lipopolysaccharide synthesis family protein n=1 Tax=Vibrio breoganii TaxID=553239 RepID=UPI000C8454D6|nr:WavE lipopolysaccharide synthesis family protein [Vibrio breoganii]PMG05815.1 WavE lipopolysaccharide synthesis [Vibrio breoganii]
MFEDISVVVQGPVQALSDRNQDEGITQVCLKSVRKYLPGATIILSTWHGQNLEGLDYDELVLCEDPGQNIRQYNLKGEPHYFNNNRQIVSTIEGLKKVKTKYAVKLRSDNYLKSNDFVEYQKRFRKYSEDYRFLKERVVVSDIFTRKIAKGLPVAFHISDFFYFGLTSDLILLWDLPLEKNFIATPEEPIDPSSPYHLVDCTQMFVLKFLQSLEFDINLKHLHDRSEGKIKISEKFIANNLVILGDSELKLGLPEKFKGKAKVHKFKGKCAHYQYYEWKLLYKKYIDNNIEVETNLFLRIRVIMTRILFIYPRCVETLFNIYKIKLLW